MKFSSKIIGVRAAVASLGILVVQFNRNIFSIILQTISDWKSKKKSGVAVVTNREDRLALIQKLSSESPG